MVHSIHVISPSRLVVGDLAESFHYVKYQRQENTFVLFADDAAPRWLTASAVLDANTVTGADKFGNIFVTRLPKEVSDDVDDAQLLTSAAANETLSLNGAPSKSDEVVQFHVGETVFTAESNPCSWLRGSPPLHYHYGGCWCASPTHLKGRF